VIQSQVADRLAVMILDGNLEDGAKVGVDLDGEELRFNV
jgi:ATP-dependent Clp protease ATP-binding subunit ClpA